MKKILLILLPIILIVFFLSTVNLKNISKQNHITRICNASDSFTIDSELRPVLNYVYSSLQSMNLSYTDLSDCINLEYQDLRSTSGLNASFRSNNKLNISIDPFYKGKDRVIVSLLLIHELVHLEQYINNRISNEYPRCIDNEIEAMIFQTLFMVNLPQGDRDTLTNIVQNTPDEYSDIRDIMNTYDVALSNCESVPESTKEDCIKDILKTKYKTDLLNSSYYQNQCHISE